MTGSMDSSRCARRASGELHLRARNAEQVPGSYSTDRGGASLAGGLGIPGTTPREGKCFLPSSDGAWMARRFHCFRGPSPHTLHLVPSRLSCDVAGSASRRGVVLELILRACKIDGPALASGTGPAEICLVKRFRVESSRSDRFNHRVMSPLPPLKKKNAATLIRGTPGRERIRGLSPWKSSAGQ